MLQLGGAAATGICSCAKQQLRPAAAAPRATAPYDDPHEARQAWLSPIVRSGAGDGAIPAATALYPCGVRGTIVPGTR